MTATAAVRLAEAGRLDLDAPVRRYLPDVRLADETVAAAVTMRDLLTHAGGFVGDWFEDYGWGDEARGSVMPAGVAGTLVARELS